MDKRIVILGSGNSGTLTANQLARHRHEDGFRIVVIDRADRGDPELDLLTAIGVYGPQSVRPPDTLQLREGIAFRRAGAAGIDLDRDEVCLTDGTTLRYDVLVVATGSAPPPRRRGSGRGPGAPTNVFTVGPHDGPAAQIEAETTVARIRRFLADRSALTSPGVDGSSVRT
ncbi:FAD-dependent oxidoreductase [Streptomyces sp. NBC_01476]|uniref:FAD-dependent oxidoreductase n=1 Tax=Streptomyces sp. NBC_01476 TaxID=2903881 RepID=UPI002E36235B|nr:FAD-dependent oxidoreductase [Streptomyces sp. NBC_01476]